jgi:tetratricopeptide (TPR) repeat protein
MPGSNKPEPEPSGDMSRGRLALLFLLAVVLTVGTRAIAQRADAPASAQEHLERGLRSYAIGNYAEAIASFRTGYELDPRPDFLYALAQAQRMSGDCAGAVSSYRAFLRTNPPERAAAGARQNLQRCEAQLAAQPPPAPAPAVTPAPETVREPAPPARPWHRDPAGATLAALGLGFAGGGGALWGVGDSAVQSANSAPRYDQFAALASSGQSGVTERTVGIVGVSLGGALLISAAARYLWLARHR